MPSPCNSVEYTVAPRNTEVVRNGAEDIYIVIDQDVQVVRTSFVVDLLTLLNRLGGTIGICKEAFLFLLGWLRVPCMYSEQLCVLQLWPRKKKECLNN